MKNVLVTNFNNSGENVMVFTNSETAHSIKNKIDTKRVWYNDIFEVLDCERQYYLYEPCHLND